MSRKGVTKAELWNTTIKRTIFAPLRPGVNGLDGPHSDSDSESSCEALNSTVVSVSVYRLEIRDEEMRRKEDQTVTFNPYSVTVFTHNTLT
jgi:hypothetical protein